MAATRFLKACTASALLVLAAIAGVNFTVDVNRVYHAGDESARVAEYVARLRASAHGMVDTSWGRAVKWELARQSEADCFVTGSSRTMIFGRDGLARLGESCREVANVAVSGAGFEDFVTAAGLIAEKPATRAIYVGIDPWALRFGADARWTRFEALYHDGRRRLGLPEARAQNHWEWLANLFNGQYFRRNLDVLRKGERVNPIRAVEAGAANVADDENILRPDGTLVYSRVRQARLPVPEGQVGNGATKIQAPYLDPRTAAEFEQALDRLGARGARVVLLLAPYHPKVFRCGSEKACAALAMVEAWARDLARRKGYGIVGSFDPRPFGIEPALFYDELHMDAVAIPRLATARQASGQDHR